MSPPPRPRVAVSECLLGHPVRYDGRRERDPWVADVLAAEAELIPLCPEVGAGMPVPRPAIELRGDPAAPRVAVVATGEDVTARVDTWIRRTLDELDEIGIAGVVLKGRSPSCGAVDVAHRGSDGELRPVGVGLFARAITRRWPHLPVIEAGQLEDSELRASFVLALQRP